MLFYYSEGKDYMKKNIIVKGDIGSGKTRNVLFPAFNEAIKNGENVVSFSTTEEYLSNFYEYVKKEGYNVIIINFNDIKRSMGWNPLSYSYKLYKENNIDEAIFQLEKVYKNLFKTVNISSSTDEFWPNSARSLAIAVTLSLFIEGDEGKINLNNVASIIRRENLKEYLRKFDNADFLIYAKSFIASPPETSGVITSVCLQTLRLYEARPNLRKMLASTTYDLEQFNAEKLAIFIINDEDNRANIPLVISYIAELCSLVKKSNNIFKFILDELEILLPSLDEDFLYQIRGAIKHNYSFMLSIQNEEMLLDKLGNYILSLAEIVESKDVKENKDKINIERVNISEKLLG